MQTKNVNQVTEEAQHLNKKMLTSDADQGVSSDDQYQYKQPDMSCATSNLKCPSPPPPKPNRGVIPPPYRQPPPPPSGELPGEQVPPQSPLIHNSNRSINDASHVYKNVAELAMYSDRFTPKTPARSSGIADSRIPMDMPTIQTNSRLTRLQQDQRNNEGGANLEKPAVSKKPGFIQQRLRSLLPHGLAESGSKKSSMESSEPKNNARLDVDPLIYRNGQSNVEGIENPAHIFVQDSYSSNTTEHSNYATSNGASSHHYSEDLPSHSAYIKDWSRGPAPQEDGHSSSRLRTTCGKLFQRDSLVQSPAVASSPNYSNIQTPASILAKNTTTSQEYDKVGQKEGVMKQLEQLESKNQFNHRHEHYGVIGDRKTPVLEVNGVNSYDNYRLGASGSVSQPEELPNDHSRTPTALHQRKHTGSNPTAVLCNENDEQEESNLFPEQTYTIEKRLRNSQKSDGQKVRTGSTPGSVSSGVYTMPNSARNSDTTSTTSPEPDVAATQRRNGPGSKGGSHLQPEVAGDSSAVDGTHKWNKVEDDLRKIIMNDKDGRTIRTGKVPDVKDRKVGDVPPGTPPLPPVSPGNSPTNSPTTSPRLHSKSKYKLSLSSSALNGVTSNSGPNGMDRGPPKIFSKKPQPPLPSLTTKKPSGSNRQSSHQSSRARRNATIAQANYKQWDSAKANHKSVSTRERNHREYLHHQQPKPSWQSNKISVSHPDDLSNLGDDMASTTTGGGGRATSLDMESLLDGGDGPEDTCYSSSEGSLTTNSHMDSNDVLTIRKQLEGLETMYSEVLKMLGSKSKVGSNRLKHIPEQLKASNKRKVVYGSLSSLSVASRSNNFLFDRNRINQDKRRPRESRGGANKRFQRLESHVVTLARSVAHLSSEMRSQHMMYQEIENIRRDMTKLREEQQQPNHHYHRHSSSAASSPTPRSNGSGNVSGNPKGRQQFTSRHNHNHSQHQPHKTPDLSTNRTSHKNERISITNCSKVKKLTKFFGTEPPLLRQFFKSLGYEKYVSSFELEGVGLLELPYLTDERFQKLGVPMGPRLRIMQEAQAIINSSNINVYIV